MKIFSKILLVILPLALLSLLSGAWGTYYLSKQALDHLADKWLQTLLTEAMQAVTENEDFLRRYSITDISSGVKKAQYDTIVMLQSIKIGRLGYVFVVHDNGEVIVHPEEAKVGTDLKKQSWFNEMKKQPTGRFSYFFDGHHNLAAYEYFPPWNWYVIVTDPISEIHGDINKTRDLVVSLAVIASLLIILLVVCLAQKMTAPLRLLVDGAQKIGKGALETRVPIRHGDEIGELSAAFNTMSTQLQKSHGALRQSEQLFRSLIENESGIIFLMDRAGITRYLSPSLHRVLGYQIEKLLGIPLSTFVHPDDQNFFNAFFEKTLLMSAVCQVLEFRLRHANGDWRVFEAISQNLLKDPAVTGIVLNARDISARKKVEEKLKQSEERLLSLMSQHLHAQEGERKRLASELHDVVGQNLLFLKFKVSSVEKGLTSEQIGQKQSCEETFEYIDQIIENVRRLCWDLVPSDLEDLGLTAAITGLLEDFTQHYKIEIEMKFDKIDDLLNQEMKVPVFRLFQEALTNIGKHAKASHIKIQGVRNISQVEFSIQDNGVGFDPRIEIPSVGSARGMGLSTMHERARILGAFFEIQSILGRGTWIQFNVPLRKGETNGGLPNHTSR